MVTILFGISIFITIGIPLISMFYYWFKDKAYRKAYWVGFSTFLIFQLLTRIPLLNSLAYMEGFNEFVENHVLLYALGLGFSAALFEEGGRFIMMTYFMKNRHSHDDAFSFGIGHWACEAISIVGLNYLIYAAMYGTFGLDHTIILGGLERLFVMPIHIAASILVMNFVREADFQQFFYALLLHTVIDSALIPLQLMTSNVYIIEGYVLICGILCTYLIHYLYKKKGATNV